MTRIAFICTGNSCRSQMAEGWARHLAKEGVEVWSAGVAPIGLNPRSVTAMKELAIDISSHRSKTLGEIPQPIDFVITVCHHADRHCPELAAKIERLHWDIEDPKQSGKEEEIAQDFRRIRDDIRRRVEEFLRQKGLAKP